MTKKLIFILLLSPVLVFSQNLDSLYNQLMSLNDLRSGKTIGLKEGVHEKCGFGIVSQVKLLLDEFPVDKRNKIQSVLDRPETDAFIISPKGYFRINYYKDGSESPGYSLTDFAVSADLAYEKEVDELGYPAPPVGNDGYYDIYLVNLGRGFYGYTEPEEHIEGDKWTTFIVMDNDFASGYASVGLEAAEVTIAHELHHAIQMGRYAFKGDDLFYHEITSTAMEEFVFPEVNDYIASMGSYFQNPTQSLSLSIGKGYDLAIWNIYLQKQFGHEILKKIWEIIPQNRALYAIGLAIQEYGSSFQYEFANFGTWLFFTGSKSDNDKFFPEGDLYPKLKTTISMELVDRPFKRRFMISRSNPISNQYLVFSDISQGFTDSLVVVFSNGDLVSAVENPFSFSSAEYILSSSNENNFTKINDLFYSLVEADNKDIFTEISIFNNSTNPTEGVRIEKDFAYPQPFRYQEPAVIYLPAPITTESMADLSIYSSGMDLIYSGVANINQNRDIVVKWNVRTNSGAKVPSGVYIYAVQAGGKIKKGKIVVINE